MTTGLPSPRRPWTLIALAGLLLVVFAGGQIRSVVAEHRADERVHRVECRAELANRFQAALGALLATAPDSPEREAARPRLARAGDRLERAGQLCR